MAQYKGIKIFDICDPDWMDGRSITEVAELVDGITCSTPAIADYLRQLTNTPIKVIPDRIDIEEHYPLRAEHVTRARSVVWFGYHSNQEVLEMTIEELRKRRLYLVVISDRPYHGANVNVSYDYNTVNEEITKHDMVLLPDFTENYRHHFKSNNKTLTAWALRMPVVKELEDLDRFMPAEAREEEAKKRYDEIKTTWDVRQSGPEYLSFIQQLKEVKKNAR